MKLVLVISYIFQVHFNLFIVGVNVSDMKYIDKVQNKS